MIRINLNRHGSGVLSAATEVEFTKQRLRTLREIGEDRARRFYEILDEERCPECQAEPVSAVSRFIGPEGCESGPLKGLLKSVMMFRCECYLCKVQWVPNGVQDFGGFGVI